jgi:hypothetical protein
VNTLPTATEETLEAHDYREQGLEEIPVESPRVMELEEIMKAIGGQEEKPVEVKASAKRRGR